MYMDKSRIHIAFCLDNKYVMPCGITIISILENNKDIEITFHIIGVGLTDISKKELDFTIKEYTNASLIHYKLDEETLQSYNLNICNTELYSIAVYARFFVADLLPKDIDKLLYLDCDMMVAKNLRPLWNIDITEYAIAGVPDPYCMYSTDMCKRLNFNDSFVYINSGALIINLKYWRENNLRDKFLDCSIENKEKLIFPDQDVINSVLGESRLFLPIKYNVLDVYYWTDAQRLNGYADEAQEAINDYVIVHFTGDSKPWLKTCQHPLKNEYLEYKKKSPWKKVPLQWQGETLNKKIKFYKRSLLYSLGLRKIKPRYISLEKSIKSAEKFFKLVNVNDNKDK